MLYARRENKNAFEIQIRFLAEKFFLGRYGSNELIKTSHAQCNGATGMERENEEGEREAPLTRSEFGLNEFHDISL